MGLRNLMEEVRWLYFKVPSPVFELTNAAKITILATSTCYSTIQDNIKTPRLRREMCIIKRERG
jgi:hypothetical protein